MPKGEMDPVLSKKLRTIFFEYYKQGFLFGNFVFNGNLLPTKVELKNLLLEDYIDFFDTNAKIHFDKLMQDNNKKESTELSVSDIIRDGKKVNGIDPSVLENKLTTCPLCNKDIYAQDVNLEDIDLSSVNNFPFDYIHVHSHGSHPPHALLMYFDAQFKVRGRKVPKFTNLK